MRVTQQHWQLILEVAEQYPEIITQKFITEDYKSKWEKTTEKLNNLGLGKLSSQEWRRRVTNWKTKTKAKAAAISAYLRGTGGRPAHHEVLTNLELRLLDMMSTKTSEPDKEGEELVFIDVMQNKDNTDAVEEVNQELSTPQNSLSHNTKVHPSGINNVFQLTQATVKQEGCNTSNSINTKKQEKLFAVEENAVGLSTLTNVKTRQLKQMAETTSYKQNDKFNIRLDEDDIITNVHLEDHRYTLPTSKPKRRKIVTHNKLITRDLLTLNKETVKLMKNITENLSDIKESLSVISSAAVQLVEIFAVNR